MSHISSGHPSSCADPRPLTNKLYIQKSVRNLNSFLIERGYGQPLSQKILTSPSSRDFQHIFEFVVRLIDPTFCFQRRMEEEVPIVLRCLGYPFTISKSALSAVGSPHTWPTLLGALNWLSGLLIYDDARRQNEMKDVESDLKALREYRFNENVAKAYIRFLQGEDRVPDLDHELIQFFEAEKFAQAAEVETLESDCRELANTLHALNTQPSPLHLITDHRVALETNIEKFSHLIPMLVAHENQVKQRLEKKTDEIAKEEKALSTIVDEKKRLLQVLRDQEKAGVVAEKLLSEKKVLQEGLRLVATQLSLVIQQFQEQEIELVKNTEFLDRNVAKYEKTVATIELPAKLEGVPDKKDLTFEASEDLSIVDFEGISQLIHGNVLPSIEALRDFFCKQILVLQEALLSMEEQKDRNEEVLIVARNKLSMVQYRAGHLEMEYQRCRNALKAQLQEQSASILRREEKILESRNISEAQRKAAEGSLCKISDTQRGHREIYSTIRRRLGEIARNYLACSKEYQIATADSLSVVKNHFILDGCSVEGDVQSAYDNRQKNGSDSSEDSLSGKEREATAS